MRAPEHSDAFNRTVRLYQTLACVQGGSSSAFDKYGSNLNGAQSSDPVNDVIDFKKKSPSRLTVQDVKKNPALSKLLIAAAKKVKEAAASSNSR